ncbi:MAG: hypothetical protein JKY71_08830, partial [Alphaproteobacteria bacterium]|nr:hypothetical protein [Alphaproteobacteria bacterium]
MKIDSKAIKELADLLDETGLNEIEVADGDKAIRVSKGGGTVVAAAAPAVSMDDGLGHHRRQGCYDRRAVHRESQGRPRR